MTKTSTGPTEIVEAFLHAFVAMDFDRALTYNGWRELPVNSVFEVHDGRIAVWRDYFDLAAAAKIHDPTDG